MSDLFNAFEIDYQSEEQKFVDLSLEPMSIEATTFLSYIHTSNNSAVGWIDDYTTSEFYTYSCISVDDGCFPLASFTNNTESFWPSEPTIGVYLVRNQAAVPEPTTAVLVGGGLLGMAMHRRRSQAS